MPANKNSIRIKRMDFLHIYISNNFLFVNKTTKETQASHIKVFSHQG